MALVALTGGMGAAVERWGALTEERAQQAALEAAEEVAWDLVEEVEAQALQSPNERWQHVGSYFEPVRAPGGVGIWINPIYPEAREAFLLEYGQAGRAPLPVLRTSITRSFQAHSEQWSASVHRRLFGG